MINNIIEWVEKTIDVTETVNMGINDIKPSKKYHKKNIPFEATETPLIVYYNNKLLDGHNRYQLHLNNGSQYVEVIVLPNLGDKIVYLDLIISEINQKLFEQRVKRIISKG